jgi:pyrroline-5-carboxylate reductase
MKITFIGGGNMAVALLGGLIKQGFVATNVTVVEPIVAQRDRLATQFGARVLEKPDAQALAADILLLAVKPQQMQEAITPLAGKLERSLVVSIAAGLSLPLLSRWLGGYRRIIRAMPNTPAMVGAGMTGLVAMPDVDAKARATAEQVLSAAGDVLWVAEEAQMDAVTAISGSGPAYLFLFLESLEKAALTLGFSLEDARKLAMGTTWGAARLAMESDEAFSLLRERVTSKGGTTAAALATMTARGVAEGIIAGAIAARDRSEEMGRHLAG